MTDKATESELSELHAVVAKVIRKGLEKHEIIMVDGEEIEISDPSPALIAQAIKFLKDNSITSTPETDTNLEELRNTLKKKQKRSALSVVPSSAAGES